MRISEIRELTNEEILDKLEDLKADMWQFRLNQTTGELKDTNVFRKTKSDAARLRTVLRERELAAEGAQE